MGLTGHAGQDLHCDGPQAGRLAGRHLELTELLHLARTQRVSEQTDNQPEGT
jgi:hypothetical protein